MNGASSSATNGAKSSNLNGAAIGATKESTAARTFNPSTRPAGS